MLFFEVIDAFFDSVELVITITLNGTRMIPARFIVIFFYSIDSFRSLKDKWIIDTITKVNPTHLNVAGFRIESPTQVNSGNRFNLFLFRIKEVRVYSKTNKKIHIVSNSPLGK